MANKVTLEIIPKNLKESISSSPATGGKGGGSLLGSLGKLGVIAGIAVSVLSVLKDMLWVFKPVKKLLSGIIKTLGAFLQPIAEVMQLVLRPILIMMKPMLLFFRTMMAPFMQIVQEMGALAASQAAQGNMSGAMQISNEMVSMIIAPFTVALSSTLGSALFDIAGMIGENFITVMYDSMAVIGAVIDNIFGTNLQETLIAKKDETLLVLNNGIDILKETLADGTATIMESMRQDSLDRLAELKDKFPSQMSGAVEEPMTEVINNTRASVTNQETGLPATERAFKKGITTINSDTFNYMSSGGKTPNEYMKGLKTMLTATKFFTEDTENYADRIKSAYNKARSAAREARDIQIGLVNIGSIVD
jgi:hypothetical protein